MILQAKANILKRRIVEAKDIKTSNHDGSIGLNIVCKAQWI